MAEANERRSQAENHRQAVFRLRVKLAIEVRRPIESVPFLPERTGLIVADAYVAQIIRPAALVPLAAARRKVEVQRLARMAMRRLMAIADPEMALEAVWVE